MIAAGAQIEIGRVISRGFEALRANFLSFLALALLFSGAIAFVTEMLLFELYRAVDSSLFLSPYFWGTLFLGIVSTAFVQAIFVRSSILSLSGRPPDIDGSIITALGLLPQLLGLTLLASLAVMIGFVMLIIPGIILSILFIVAVPALVEERRGVIGSMKRSAQLTKGSRGSIFGLLIVWLLLLLGISFAWTSLMEGFTAAMGPWMVWASATTQAVLATILDLITGTIVASLYVELRTAKEGATTDVLADIFA